MKLQAITVCVNYSDYLECILDNRVHFDRWIIATCASDAATQNLCSTHGIECVVSRVLSDDGADFDAAFNKSRVINEALDLLDTDAWAVILDADVLLPRLFRQRIETTPLHRGCIYGVKGRRICGDYQTFRALKVSEPWEADLKRNSQPLGYFNLFHLAAEPNRYPSLPIHRGRLHDDDHFIARFDPAARRLLPMSVLHVGAPQVDWHGRVSAICRPPNVKTGASSASSGFERVVEGFKGAAVAAMVGVFPGGPARAIASRVTRLYLVDHFNIQANHKNPLIEGDRIALREALEGELSNLENVSHLGSHCSSVVANIPDASLDVLYFSGRLESFGEVLFAALPLWLKKLKPDGTICGDGFSSSTWPNGVATISSLLGAPDSISEDGFWAKVNSERLRRAGERAPSGDTEGIVIVDERTTMEALMMSMYSARANWAGPIAVYHRGNDAEAVRRACWRLQCEYHYLGAPIQSDTPDGEDLMTVAPIQRFARALLLRSGMLAVKALAPSLFMPASPHRSFTTGPYLIDKQARSCSPLAAADVCAANDFDPTASFLICEGDPASWSDAAWAVWSEQKVSMIEETAVEIRMRSNPSVVIVANYDEFGDLQQQWPAMHFPEDTTLLLVLLGVSEDEAWLPGRRQPSHVVFLPDEKNCVPGILRAVLAHCKSEKVIFLAPSASPLGGCELFLSLEWDEYRLVVQAFAETESERQITGNVFVPAQFSGMVCTKLVEALIDRDPTDDEENLSLAAFMYIAALSLPETSISCDLRKQGWHLPPVHHYVPSVHLRLNVDRAVSIAAAC